MKSICEKTARGTYTGQLEATFHSVKCGSPTSDGGRPLGVTEFTVGLLLYIGCTKTSQLRRKAAVSKGKKDKLSDRVLKLIFEHKVSFAK